MLCNGASVNGVKFDGHNVYSWKHNGSNVFLKEKPLLVYSAKVSSVSVSSAQQLYRLNKGRVNTIDNDFIDTVPALDYAFGSGTIITSGTFFSVTQNALNTYRYAKVTMRYLASLGYDYGTETANFRMWVNGDLIISETLRNWIGTNTLVTVVLPLKSKMSYEISLVKLATETDAVFSPQITEITLLNYPE